MDLPFKAPSLDERAFNCPWCRAYSAQGWYKTIATHSSYSPFDLEEVRASRCAHCRQTALWLRGKLIDPASRNAPPPNADLSPEIQADYNEAAEIEHASPKGAAALLRLCLQRLCADLGGNTGNINSDIQKLVQDGLPVAIQQALDVVRVVGNNAVHPGTINLDDNPETVSALFLLINAIADRMITQPKKVAELYGALPPGVLDAIKKRDAPKP